MYEALRICRAWIHSVRMENPMGEPKREGQEEIGKLEAQVLRLSDLVDYQEGAVVSREIVHQGTGTVTLFAFDQGQGLGKHTAPFDALVHLLEGQAEIAISGQPFRLQAGEIIIMPAHEPHALKALKRFKMMLVMIRS